MVFNQALFLMFIALAIAVLPGLSRMLRLPTTVAEILLGIVIGQTVLQGSFGGDWLPFLAQLGFLLLMFLAGMEIDFTLLKEQTRSSLLQQVGLFAGTLSLSLLAALALGQGVFFGLVLSTTSLGLVMPTLRETGLSKTRLGQSVLIAATLADFLTLLGITFFILWHKYGLSIEIVYPIPLFAAFALLLWVFRLWAWWHPDKAERIILTEDTEEQGVRLSLALLFVFVGLSELQHIEPVLGAFMGGCIISYVFREKEFLESKISALGFGFLIPIFFIHVGMQFDLSNVLEPGQLLFTLMLLGMAFLVKILPSLFFPVAGIKMKTRFQAGLLLCSRLSLIVAAASIGVEEGFLSSSMKDSIVLLALMTCLLGPVLFKVSLGKQGR